MVGFRTLTAGLWQVKVGGIEEGPAGTIQATFVANEVSCVHHLYTVFVVRHQPGDLLICLLVFRDVELRKNQNLFSLQPVDVGQLYLCGLDALKLSSFLFSCSRLWSRKHVGKESEFHTRSEDCHSFNMADRAQHERREGTGP